MLQIIKTQLKYIINNNLYAILPIHFAIILYGYLRDFNPINLVFFFLFTQYVAFVLLNNSKERRDYTFNLIAITIKEIAFTRIVLVYLGFIIIYSIAVGLHIFLFSNSESFNGGLHELFMFGGITICGIFFYIVFVDYFSIVQSKSAFLWFNIIMGLIIGVLGFAAIIGVENSYYHSVESSTELIVLIYFCSVVLATISFVSYQKRESYLGYD